ncbi:MAG: DUF5320 domain-containing protein [Candidatus Omnitrophica bacterium]|nr:DUF5320 domain-containing protein [Candidatus Omnitrophota bacterium]
MPGYDGTGPRGQGSMTGGGRGYCVMPVGEAGKESGKVVFEGGGRGRGRRNCFYVTGLPGWMRLQRGMQAFGGFSRAVSKEEELDILKSQADLLKQKLENIQTRINDLESKKGVN